jgi:hypothetical protein
MVLMNGAKKARSQSSIVNQNQGGGPKKAGLAPVANIPAATFIAYSNRHLPKPLSVMRFTVNPNVKQSRPIYGRPQNYIGQGGNY